MSRGREWLGWPVSTGATQTAIALATPLGTLGVEATEDGSAGCGCPAKTASHRPTAGRRRRTSRGMLLPSSPNTSAASRPEFELDLDWAGRRTEHRHLLEVLCEAAPFGVTVTYGELGRHAGIEDPRDVGTLMGRNPLPLVVPATGSSLPTGSAATGAGWSSSAGSSSSKACSRHASTSATSDPPETSSRLNGSDAAGRDRPYVGRGRGDVRARTGRRELIADSLRALRPEEVPVAVAYLAGELPQGSVGVGWASLRVVPSPALGADARARRRGRRDRPDRVGVREGIAGAAAGASSPSSSPARPSASSGSSVGCCSASSGRARSRA